MIHTLRPSLSNWCGCLVLASLVGCIAPKVHEEAPPNYSLTGVWELNPALSSDTDKVLASLQPKPRRGLGPGGAPGTGAGDRPAPEVINDPTTDLPPIDPTTYGRNLGMAGYYPTERNTYRPPIEMQTNALLGGQWLKIRQTDSEMSIVNAATTNTYT